MSLRRRCVAAGAALLLGCAALAFLDPRRAAAGYLLGWEYWLGISVGALGLSLLHELTGGAWGRDLAPALRGARAALPWVGLLSLPVLAGTRTLYAWSSPGPHVNTAWLNAPFFRLRTLGYFLFWWLVSSSLARWRAGGPEGGWGPSGRALLAWVIVVSFAGMDWLMSLEAPWVSTIYGLQTVVAYGLAALAAATFVVCRWAPPAPGPEAGHGDEPARRLQDLGSLLMAFLMLWAYTAFSQYLIIWSANLPEEIPWYLRRGSGGWQWVAAALAVLHFGVPFFLLLLQDVKRDPRRLAGVAALIAAVHLVERWWLIFPAFGGRPSLEPAALLAWAGVGLVWVAAFAGDWRPERTP